MEEREQRGKRDVKRGRNIERRREEGEEEKGCKGNVGRMERGKTKKGSREVTLMFVDVQYGPTSHFKHSTAFHWIERNFLHCHSWSLHLLRPYE